MAEPRPTRARVLGVLVQVVTSLGLLLGLCWYLDFAPLSAARARPGFVGLALLCTVPAYALAALRWAFTAERLGVALGFRRALREVYAANLLNCVLPSGVAGEVLRVARHGQRLRQAERAIERPFQHALAAVLLERLSGQLVLWAVLACSVASWSLRGPVLGVSLAALLLTPLALGLWLRRSAGGTTRVAAVWRAVHQALLARGALWVQLATSTAVLLCCVLGFLCAGRGLGLALSAGAALRIVPPLLFVSALPVSIGGFGVREAASALLCAAAGLDPGTGAAAAGLYGLMNVVGALPGVAALWPASELRA